jgi:DNA-binding response OmpR family regulator
MLPDNQNQTPAGAKVMIVEDEEMLREMYATAFQLENFDVTLAEDGEAALAKLQQIRPNIILLDVMMPKMNGMETLTKIKADPNLKDIPVIMLSNLADEENFAQAQKIGAFSYIIKSDYIPQQVVEQVQKALSISQS